MKQKILNIFLLLLSFKAVGQTDSLILVKQSRIGYCNAKIEQVQILNTRIIEKDAAAVILNNRIANKEEEISSLHVSINTYKMQLLIKEEEKKEEHEQNLATQTENKQLKKQNRGLKVGLVGAVILILWSWISP